MKNVFFLCIFSLVLFSCERSEEIKGHELISDKYVKFDFHEESINNIGHMHNKFLTSSIDNMNMDSESLLEELKIQMLNNDKIDLDISKSEFLYLGEDFDINEHLSYFENPTTSVQYYEKIFDLMDKDYENVEKLIIELDNLKHSAKNELQNQDLQLIEIAISVAKSSNIMWYPISKGGWGYGQKLMYLSPRRRLFRGCGETVAGADVAGVTGAVVKLAYVCAVSVVGCIGTAANPITTSTILGGIAFAGAWASGSTALFCWGLK